MKMTKKSEIAGGRELLALFARVLVATSVVAAAIPLPLCATVYVVGGDEDKECIIGSGSATQSDRISVADGGILYKNGNGTLTIPCHVFQQLNPATLGLKRGPMTLTLDETAANRTAPVTPSVLQDALFWVDASLKSTRPELFVAHGDSETEIEKWYDVRETNPSAPSYLYGHANFVTNYTDTWPSYAVEDGFPAIYFNGVGSGTAMDWVQPNGTAYCRLGDVPARQIHHVFAVHGVKNSYGFIFGSHNGAHFHPGGYNNPASSLAHPYWIPSGPTTLNLTTWLDGSLIDGRSHLPEKGFHVLEASTNKRYGSADVFFRDRTLFSSSVGWRSGGDYLCEVIAFTNRLSATQRAEINAYLAAKWFPGRSCEKHVLLGGDPSSLTLTINAQVDGTVRLAGTGDVVKVGSGNLKLGLVPGHRWSGSLTVQSGTVTYLDPLPVPVAAGMRLTSVITNGDSAVTLAENATSAHALLKDGAGDATVTSIPQGVRTVAVNAGRLTLSGARQPAAAPQNAGTQLEIALQNPGLEEWDAADANLVYKKLDSSRYHGWGCVGGYAFTINYANWPLTGVGGMDGASRNAWGLKTIPPGTNTLTSKSALFLRSPATHAFQPIGIARGGWYELSFDMCGRENDTFSYLLHVFILNNSGSTTLADFGYAQYSGWKGSFQRQRLVAYIPPNSQGNLHLLGANTADMGAVLDNFRLRYLAANRPDEVAVPGGDFESTELYGESTKRANTFSTANTMAGWTFTQSPDAAPGETTVGLATHGMPFSNMGQYYNDSRGPGHGYAMVRFMTNGTASTTFTPAAGTWYVRAQVASYDANDTGVLSLSAAVGDAPAASLGDVTSKMKMLHDETWGKPFAVDGTTPVTLTFSFSMTGKPSYPGGFFLDDVRLVPASSVDAGVFDIPSGLSFDIGEDAGLVLDFAGTNEVRSIRRAGHYVQGVIDASTCDWVSGPGALYAPPVGTTIIFR